jgi:phenylpyruvate tautomerase PptA (4-oxalocrotonate tautomerase family)
VPFIRITVFGSTLTAEQIRQLQQGTTDMMTSIMRKPIEGTAVLVELINQGGWSIAGNAVPIAAHVEATIGQDRNMPDEKSHRRNDDGRRIEPPRWLPPLF